MHPDLILASLPSPSNSGLEVRKRMFMTIPKAHESTRSSNLKAVRSSLHTTTNSEQSASLYL
jgi:hypothetical protein